MAAPSRQLSPSARPLPTDLPTRDVFVYDLPQPSEETPDAEVILSLAAGGGPNLTSMGFHMLTPTEEKSAMRKAEGNGNTAMVFELGKASIAEVNGVRVFAHDGSLDKAWADYGPQGRRFAIEAYGDLSGVREDTVKSFLKSRRVKSG